MIRRVTSPLPAGFLYQRDLLSADEERELVEKLQDLEFRNFEFRGYVGKRRVFSFGWRYDFGGGGLRQADPIPDFLLAAQGRAATFAGLRPADLQHVLLTEYQPGAAIGWHRDRSEFGDVVGISLLSPCTFRFRRRGKAGWDRASLRAEPRSAYLLRGNARTEWEHSIPAVDSMRYSITFRTLKAA
jgi:alkylated DNA repair dioxygenase AlkB